MIQCDIVIMSITVVVYLERHYVFPVEKNMYTTTVHIFFSFSLSFILMLH